MWNNLFINVEVMKGTSIHAACSQVKELSELLKQDFTFDFNKVAITTKDQSISSMINGYTTQTK